MKKPHLTLCGHWYALVLAAIIGGLLTWMFLPNTRRSAAEPVEPSLNSVEDIQVQVDRSRVARIRVSAATSTSSQGADCPEEQLPQLLDALCGTYVPVSYQDPRYQNTGTGGSGIVIRLYDSDGSEIDAFTLSGFTYALSRGDFFYQKADGALEQLIQSLLAQ